MAIHVVKEAERCLQCKKPLCRTGCPINTSIPEFIGLFRNGNIDEAGKVLFENNPFSIVCSIVCDHDAQCEGHCILNNKGVPINVSSIENYISSYYFDKYDPEPVKPNGMKAAIIGGGPAGITVALLLATKGYYVTIFESREKLGGVLRYGIPEFRLPHTILDKYKDKLTKLGVHIRPNAVIGRTLNIDDLFADGYDSVFLGTGVWRPKRLNIPGETLGHVHFAINYLLSPDEIDHGENVVVIGAGNSAMDVARTAIRKGAKHVYLMCRKPKSRAAVREVEYAVADGVEFMYGAAPTAITEDGVIYRQATFDAEGNTVSTEEGLFRSADCVILAVSQGLLHRVINGSEGISVDEWDTLSVDEKGQTSREGIFAAGDVSTGAATVVEAVRDAKVAADSMDKYMQSLKK